MRVGFVQSGAIGDIVIALPAAKWYVDRGFDVFWPIDYRYLGFFRRAAPYVNFLEVPQGVNPYDWHLGVPYKLLAQLQVKDIFTLYMRLESNGKKFDFGQPYFLTEALKFDEYKYAIANVPFTEKWNLALHRDPAAEARVLEAIGAHRAYTLVHQAPGGSCRDIVVNLGDELVERAVHVQAITDSPFDWIAACEKASLIAFEDSVHANVVEQLNLMVPKQLFLRSPCAYTPVFKNGWKFR